MKVGVTVASQWNGKDVQIRGHSAMKKSIFEIGLIVEGQAKLLSPVVTGRLAGSYTTQSASQGTESKSPASAADKIAKPGDAMEVLVGTAVEYAPYVEFGTVKSSAQPALRPALALARGQALTVTMRNGRYEFKDYL